MRVGSAGKYYRSTNGLDRITDGRNFRLTWTHSQLTTGTVAANHVSLGVKERRRTARIEAPFPARLKGVDSTGHVFTEHAVLDNLSTGGLHMCVRRNIPLGVEVTVAVRLSADAGVVPALRLAARGKVVRTDPRPDGSWGVAVEFTRRRIL
jgi:hypothetical protein